MVILCWLCAVLVLRNLGSAQSCFCANWNKTSSARASMCAAVCTDDACGNKDGYKAKTESPRYHQPGITSQASSPSHPGIHYIYKRERYTLYIYIYILTDF